MAGLDIVRLGRYKVLQGVQPPPRQAAMTSDATREQSYGDRLLGLAAELYQFLSSIEKPRLSEPGWAHDALQRCQELGQRVSTMRDSMRSGWTAKREAISAAWNVRREALSHSLDEVTANLRAYSRELAERPNLNRLRGVSGALAKNYEALLAQLRAMRAGREADGLLHVKHVNYARHAFHVMTGVVCVLLYEFVVTWPQAMGVLIFFTLLFAGLEISRRYFPRWNDFLVDKVFGAIVRPWERHRVNASTWLLLALTLITAFTPRVAVQAALLVLAFGDPAAALCGKRWGKRKLWRERTWVGTSAFFAAGAAATLIFLGLAVPDWSFMHKLGLALTVALVGAVVEVSSGRLEDNFTIPVACALAAWPWV